MNTKRSHVLFFLGIVILTASTRLLAQEEGDQKRIRERLREMDIELPFIDNDGDGINDCLQNGWGLRFMNRYMKRQELWDLLNVEIVHDEDGMMVDTDGDGIGDISFRDFMKSKMDELIDTDSDGVPDTPIRNYFGKGFKAFDRDGDGLPDDFTKEEMREMMGQMRQWRQEIRDRIHEGLPPFIDDNGDGVPDNMPEGFQWRGGSGGSGGSSKGNGKGRG